MDKPDDPYEGRGQQILTRCPLSPHMYHGMPTLTDTHKHPNKCNLKKKVSTTTKEGPERKAKSKKHLRQKLRLSKQSLRFYLDGRIGNNM